MDLKMMFIAISTLFVTCLANNFQLELDISFIAKLDIKHCEKGLFFDYNTQKCLRCQAGCGSCFGLKNNCTSCASEFQFLMLETQFYDLSSFSQQDSRRLVENWEQQAIAKREGNLFSSEVIVEDNSVQVPDYLLPEKQYRCRFCQELEGQTLSETEKKCESCPMIDNCASCLDQEKCLKCQPGYFLDLVTFQCIENCQNIDYEISYQTSVCREKYDFFIDTKSEEKYEFGTKEYPYKSIFYAAKEIFNSLGNVESEVKVMLEQNSEDWIDSESEPFIFGGLEDLKIIPYSKEEGAEIVKYPTLGFNDTQKQNTPLNFTDSQFNFFSIIQDFGDYKIDERLENGELNNYNFEDLNGNRLAIENGNFFETTVTMENLRITTDNLTPEFVLQTYYSITHKVTIQHCICDMGARLLIAKSGTHVQVLNNELNYYGERGNIIRINTKGEQCDANRPENSRATLKGNIITNYNLETRYTNWLISSNGKVNITVEDNQMINVYGKIDGDFFVMRLESEEGCALPGHHSVEVNNNIIKGVPYKVPGDDVNCRFLRYGQHDEDHWPGTMHVRFTNNTFEDITFAGNMIQLEARKPMKAEIRDVKFIRAHVYYPDRPLIFTNFEETIVENVQLIDSDLSYFIKAEGALIMDNIEIDHLYSEYSGNPAVITVSNAEYFKAQSFEVKNIQTETYHLFDLNTVNQFQLEGMQSSNSKFLSNFFEFYETQSAQINDLELEGIVQADQSAENFYFMHIPTFIRDNKHYQFNINSLNIADSELSLITIDQFASLDQVGDDMKQYEFNFNQVKFTKTDLNGKIVQGFVHIPQVQEKNLSFTFKNIELEIKNLNSVLFNFLANCHLNIETLKVENFNKPLFWLTPLEESVESPNLEVMAKNLKVKNVALDGSVLIFGTKKVNFELDGFEFEGLVSTGRGSAVFVDQLAGGVKFNFTNGSFKNCQSNLGGVFHATQRSKIEFHGVDFYGNSAFYGGVGYLNDDSLVILDDCEFVQNSASLGDIIYSINSSQNNVVRNSVFKENGEKDAENQEKRSYFAFYKTSFIFDGKMQVFNCYNFLILQAQSFVDFKELVLKDSQIDSLAQVFQSEIDTHDFQIENLSQTVGQRYFIVADVNSIIVFEGLKIDRFDKKFLKTRQSTAKIEELELKNIDLQNQNEPLFHFSSTDSIFDRIEIKDLKIDNSQVFCFVESEIAIKDLTSQNIDVQLIQGIKSQFKIENVQVSNENQDHNSMIDSNKALIELESSSMELSKGFIKNFDHFQGIKSYNHVSSDKKCDLKVKEFNFEMLNSQQGSAIQVQNVNLDVQNSNFNKNNAKKSGGALSLLCSQNFSFECKFHLESSTFSNNQAFQGGAIDFNLYPPEIVDCAFEDNEITSSYGKDISSYPQKLELVQSPEFISSGFPNESGFVVEIRDHFDNVVSEGIDGIVRVYSDNLDTSVLGIKEAYSQNGVFVLDEIEFLGEPEELGHVKFETELINKEIYLKVEKEEFEPYEFEFTYRKCREGEILSFSQCITCSKNSYSLDLDSTKCEFCPNHFSCEGGNKLLIDKGYWRPSLTSVEAYECLNPEACPENYGNECSPGYKGVLCAECAGKTEEGYYASAIAYSCQVCEESSIIWLKIFAVFVSIVAYVVILSALIIYSSSRSQYSSVLMRILTNYFQITLLIRNLKIQWPERVEKLLNSLSIVQSIQKDMFQFSCIFKGTSQNTYALSVILMILLPFVMSLLALLLWKLLSILRPKKFRKTYQRNSVLTAGVIGYLSYPMINTYAFQGFNCRQIEGKNYFIEDFSIECYKGEHLTILFTSVIPAILIWTLGFPFYTYYQLRKNRKRLDERETIIKYGIFYIGLRDETVWWEVIISNLKKAIIIGITTSVTANRSFMQLLLVFSIQYAIHQLIKYFEPYQEEWLNSIDLFSSNAAICAILLGCLFVDNEESGKSALMELVFWILLLINVTFLIRLAFLIIQINVKKLKKMVDKQYTMSQQKSYSEGFHYNRYEISTQLRNKKEEEKKKTKRNIDALDKLSRPNQDFKFQVETIPSMLNKMEQNSQQSSRGFALNQEYSARPMLSTKNAKTVRESIQRKLKSKKPKKESSAFSVGLI